MLLTPKTPQSIFAPVGSGGNFSEVVALKNGGYMAVWTQQVLSIKPVAGADDESGTAIFAQVFDSNGVATGSVIQVNEKTEGFQDDVDLTVLKNGDVVVAWTDGPGTVDFDVDARAAILAPNGTIKTTEFELAGSTTGEQSTPQITALANGGFQAAWLDEQTGYGDRWFTQTFGKTGNRVGDEVPIEMSGGNDGTLLSLKGGIKVLLSNGSADIYAWGRQTVEPNSSIEKMSDYAIASVNGDGYTGVTSDAARVSGNRIAVARQDGADVKISFYQIDRNGSAANDIAIKPFTVAEHVYASQGNDVTLWSHAQDSASDYVTPPTYFRPETELVELSGGRLLVLYTAVTGGSSDADATFSLFAQLMTNDGSLLGDRETIDADFRPSALGQLNRPYGVEGDNGEVFIGWTTTSDRNGDGTVEVTGGTYSLAIPESNIADISNGDDRIYGTNRRDLINAGAGDDVVFGLGGNDILSFTEGADALFGGTGNDRFVTGSLASFTGAGANYPVIDGGDGIDLLDLRKLFAGVEVSDSIRTINGIESNRLRNVEKVVTTNYADEARLQDSSFSSNDIKKIWLMGGNDKLEVYSGSFVADGGRGVDTVDMTRLNSTDVTLEHKANYYQMSYADGGSGANDFSIRLTAFEHIEFADTTVDLAHTNATRAPSFTRFGGFPEVRGNAQNNTLNGTVASENIFAGKGNDKAHGRGGNDRIDGALGNDTLYGDNGNDSLLGGKGNDKLFGGNGDDDLLGGAGRDRLIGGNGADTMDGQLGNDFLNGGKGADELSGGGGRDKLFGGADGDRLHGGRGNDLMVGGAGNDTFVFHKNDGKDRIRDFESTSFSQSDTLYIGSDLLTGFPSGTQIVDDYASVVNGNIEFRFSATDVLTLVGFTDLDALKQHVFYDYIA